MREVVPAGKLDRARSAGLAGGGYRGQEAATRQASHYSDIEVDLDADGETLVLEFPADAAFAMQMAEEPEMRDMLRVALSSVFGFTPSFRFQLGRGSVRPQSAPAPAHRAADIDDAPAVREADDEPLPEYYETATGMTEPVAQAHSGATAGAVAGLSANAGEPKSELERLLMHDLGGQIIGEHAAPDSAGELESATADGDDIETADPGQDGPGLFDTDGED